jgi:hypothetical protein
MKASKISKSSNSAVAGCQLYGPRRSPARAFGHTTPRDAASSGAVAVRVDYFGNDLKQGFSLPPTLDDRTLWDQSRKGDDPSIIEPR